MGAISTEIWQMLRLGWGTLLPLMGTWYPNPWLLSKKPPLVVPLSENTMSRTDASSGTCTSACRKPPPPGTTGFSSRGPIWACSRLFFPALACTAPELEAGEGDSMMLLRRNATEAGGGGGG
ncbi:MAG: hypothetical protein FRX49_05095 [Trebouxia sp. A1-2]|nr:MAG: hypothetical protein FRX49_05095 [Trebouxia sp. A1-2]